MKNILIMGLIFMVLCSEIACTKAFQPIQKLNDLVEKNKFSELYTELSANRNSYNDKTLIYYDLILNSILNKPEESNALIQKFSEQFTSFSDYVELKNCF